MGTILYQSTREEEMKLHLRTFRWALLPQRIRGIFNLNDPRWGRSDDKPSEGGNAENEPPEGNRPDSRPNNNNNNGGPRRGPNQGGPPDLDELWRDFNKKLGGLFGGGNNSGRGGGSGGGFQPDMKNAGIGVALIAGVVLLIWLGTGFFIVQEGQQAVITQFGKYKSSVGAGFNWRLPYPIQRHELVFVTQIRSVEVGGDNIVTATGLRESAMLTADENIVEIKFAVQYRLNDARAFLFESREPIAAVVQAAETAVREVVGSMTMDSALSEERDQIGPRVRVLMQTILDRYKVGIEVVGINLQQSGVRPPEQVQAAFDDVLRAGQERERAKNEAQAYANDVIPRAVGSASRLKQEADAYKAKLVAQAQGDGDRFKSLLVEYQKSPKVTRDRLYIEAMQQVYTNVTKVMIDSRQGSNLLYLPLDKLMQMSGQTTDATAVPAPMTSTAPANATNDARARDVARARERDTR
ncbi:MAG: membrane protease subunit HflK [Rhodoferax sp.]